MDDLNDWSWFRGTSFYDFAIKFYGATRYRPTFEAVQYFIYTIIGTEPQRFVLINKIYNIIIATFIYYITKKISGYKIFAIITSIFYIIAHFSYYQISQGIGSIESTALLLSILILYLCIKIVEDNKLNTKTSYSKLICNFILIFLLFFLLVFDHERYLFVAGIIFIAIFFMKMPNDNEFCKNNASIENSYRFLKFKAIILLLFIIEIIAICYIRYLAIGKIIPAGTGGTYVEDTFSIKQFITYCFTQVAIILGINIGPEHLYGIDFFSINNNTIKYLTIISILIISFIILLYFAIKIKNIKNKSENIANETNANQNFIIDLLFLTFISFSIASTSVTIRVEMRFVYTSFIVSVIYLSYMLSYIIKDVNKNYIKIIMIFLFVSIFSLRLPIELVYRDNYDKLYCFVDLKRVNSLYDLTIGEYGLDNIINKDDDKRKKIIIVNKYYNMTKFYSEYFFKIYDKDDVGNIITLVNDFNEIDVDKCDENTIILYEDPYNNIYVNYTF